MSLPIQNDRLVSSYARLEAKEFARRGIRIALIGVLIALAMTYATGRMEWDTLRRSIVYSVSVSVLSWFFIDGGRFFLNPDPDTGWPRGWRGLALSVTGCMVGFAVGSALADLINGFPVYNGYRQGSRSLRADLLGSMAVGACFSGFYYLRGQSAYQDAQLARAERDLTLARLTMLQSQLEPHMLFNTLANLRVLIGIDPPRAQAMLDRMIAYLRATLDGSRLPLHPLSAEFVRLADYLALMSVRMGPRLQVHFELPDSLRTIPVPPMLLQPLVENSIKHGLEPKLDGGWIEVSAHREGDQLVLKVRDTGVGLAESPTGDTSSSNDSPHAPTSGTRFGLTQVRERLATLHGPRASFTLQAAGDTRGGVVASISLPLPAAETHAALKP